jgi:hypothetical protein
MSEAGMDGPRRFLECVRRHGWADENLLGLLHVVIGRRITDSAGEVVSKGLTWREAAALLTKVRWDKDTVVQLGLDPKQLPPRDRARYWYTAIAQARVDSPQARAAGDQLAQRAEATGYRFHP